MLSLNRFTRYQYQLEVENDVAVSSGEIVTAVTMAGIPRRSPSVSAYAINHTAVEVKWTQPCKTIVLDTHMQIYSGSFIAIATYINMCDEWKSKNKDNIFYDLLLYSSNTHVLSFPALQDLQGEVESYFLTVESVQSSQVLAFPPEIISTTISDLWPSTTYLVSLQVSNGAHNTTQARVNVTTKDGGTRVFVLLGGDASEWILCST